MQYLGDGILAGRALYKYWEHEDGIRGDKSIAPKAKRATDDLLSDGLMRALLFTRCYRSPGLDQLFVEVSVWRVTRQPPPPPPPLPRPARPNI